MGAFPWHWNLSEIWRDLSVQIGIHYFSVSNLQRQTAADAARSVCGSRPGKCRTAAVALDVGFQSWGYENVPQT